MCPRSSNQEPNFPGLCVGHCDARAQRCIEPLPSRSVPYHPAPVDAERVAATSHGDSMAQAFDVITEFKKMLTNLDACIEIALAHAKAKSFEPSVLVNARLAPDMYPFVKQVQSCCDSAKFAAARLAGKDPPVHPDTEQTVDELRARLKTVVTYLEGFKDSDFNGFEKRMVALPFMAGKGVLGSDYLNELAIPNFYFHVTTAYAILRHNGAPVGKMNYIGSMNLKDL
ncbi:MAG: DUF1993 family protein [Polyangiales bacterium]